MNEELQQQIELLSNRVKSLETTQQVPDHFHSGFDNSRIRIKDLDTIFFKQATINPISLVDGAGETIQVTGVTGATLGDWVLISAPYSLQGITVTAYVQATSVVEIRIQNESGSIIDLGIGIWRIFILKKIV
uniref:Uncharacterized protein n=1 Tax=viral metagenome TaxID=1070528 RepID=A0A6H1ZMS9_9ZZZZ